MEHNIVGKNGNNFEGIYWRDGWFNASYKKSGISNAYLVRNNFVYENVKDPGFWIWWGGGIVDSGKIFNNTIVFNGNGINSGGEIKNNIISQNFGGIYSHDNITCNYNVFWGNEHNLFYAVVSDGVYYVDVYINGAGNISKDPLLNNIGAITSIVPTNINDISAYFHVNTYSPTIDAGDPDDDYSKEPEPNGGRINMGAYGNTPEARSEERRVGKEGRSRWSPSH